MTMTLDDTVVTEADDRAEQRSRFLADQLDAAANHIELLTESLADIELAREDRGWKRIGLDSEMQFSREGLRTSAQLCRAVAIGNPLMKRGISLRTAYIWGSGVQISARATGDNSDNTAEQDVDAVVQAFLSDEETKKVLVGAAARIRNERTLATDGNLHCALWTSRATGNIRPRLIPFDEINKVISNPEDATERWFFLRVHTVQVSEPGTLPDTTRLRTETRRVLYPSIDYRPATRPATYGGLPIEWDAPIVEMNVNGLDTWDFGIGDAFSAVEWARAYSGMLTDWTRIVKSLSRHTWKSKSPTGRVARNAEDAQRAAQRNLPVPGPNGSNAGSSVNLGPGQEFEAISKSGAVIDAGSGRPVAAMVAAGLDVPVTMLLADPGVTGARATAETLDKPTELMATTRRDEWSDYLRRILGYVIDMSIRAPGGALKGTMIRDRFTGRLITTLAGDTDRTIEITWPDLSKMSLKDLVDAIKTADDTGKLPPLEIVKMLLNAFGVTDIDEIIDKVTDDDGNWIDPQANAGQAAIDSFRRGGGAPTFDAPPADDAEA